MKTQPPGISHPTAEHHRNVQQGAARAAVFGISDGLVTNISLILGVAGAQTNAGYVRLAGFAGLLAGAFSMAAGEYVSMRAQSELLQRELDLEKVELARSPEAEHRELAAIYERRGLEADVAADMARQMMRTPEMALETHAREELGIGTDDLGSPISAAGASFASFAIGAVIPLLPWFFTSGLLAVLLSGAGTALAALLVGLMLARATDRPAVKMCLRQLATSALAAGIAFAIGRLVGIHVT